MIVPVELYFISETEPTSEHPSPSRDMYGNPALYEIGRGCHARHVCCDGPRQSGNNVFIAEFSAALKLH